MKNGIHFPEQYNIQGLLKIVEDRIKIYWMKNKKNGRNGNEKK